MVFLLSSEEINFITNNECCRLATSFKNKPHVAPVCYVFVGGYFFVSTDYGTKKLKNIKHNPFVSLVIDVYVPQNHKGIIVNGCVDLVEYGESYKKIYTIFFNKFEWVKKDPWIEGQSPFLKINPSLKVSWGLEK
jgi:nitroimidazol reductase NimA-like FMN-containing flavoprotein (pyridoxamine 5'-phosphate oxidase superfamily)